MEVEDDDGWDMEESWEDQGDAQFSDGGEMEEQADHKEQLLSPIRSTLRTRQFSFEVMDAKELKSKTDRVIADCAELLSVTHDEADCLLRTHLWDRKKLQNSWFADQQQVRQSSGVSEPRAEFSGVVQCSTAFCDEVPTSEAMALNCGHWFCNTCWEGFLTAQINGGRSCINATCMGMRCNEDHMHRSPSCACNEIVPASVVASYITDTVLLNKYLRWQLTSFVEGHSTLKFCPNPACSAALHCTGGLGDVVCRCGARLCFLCSQEGHYPAPCDLIHKWRIKEKSDDANEIWLRARTKQCPKCQVRIEKNKACNHMTCSHCSHQFCWLCKGDWASHGTSTGGFYACTKYDEAVKQGKRSNEEKSLMDNTRLLQKYTYYYKRYKGMIQSISLTHALKNRIEEAMVRNSLDQSRYAFLSTALNALIEARRVLQFTYVLAYYIRSGAAKTLFEYQQQRLTEGTETLQDLVETHNPTELLERRRSSVVNRTATLVRLCSEMTKRVDSGEFDDALLGEADINSDMWGCVACGMDNKQNAPHCVACSACQAHGEPECKACVRLTQSLTTPAAPAPRVRAR
jgi:ariadne-1